jgi:hypothetical protein
MKTIFKASLSLLAIIAFSQAPLRASDTSDAEQLRTRCEKENKNLEVAVTNFGDASDQSNFQEGVKKLKLAKLKITQSAPKDASALYNEYLKLQNEIYTSLANKYLERTKKINDEISEEFVDSIDKPNVDKYFKMAYRNLEDAKTAMTRKYPTQAIDACRRSKSYSIGVYKLEGKPVPDKYKTDLVDSDGKIAGK